MKRRLRISREIVNYRTALTLARETLEARPLSLSLLQQLHTLLMSSVRGQNKSPGEFRKDQNWIGPPGCTQKEATFVPSQSAPTIGPPSGLGEVCAGRRC